MNRHEIDVIEKAVTIPEVLELHGIKRHGTRCRCPLHNGDRDSFSFTDTLFHCFTCGESGGVIQLEALLSGVSNDEACRILARQYGLDIDDGLYTKRDWANWRIQRRVEEDYADYMEEKNTYYLRLSNLYRNIVNVPELSDTAQDLGKWLDDNINGVIQPWRFQGIR